MSAHIDEYSCFRCGACEAACQNGAITLTGDLPLIDKDKCVDCGMCAAMCRAGAIRLD